jgi:hypothetical protein
MRITGKVDTFHSAEENAQRDMAERGRRLREATMRREAAERRIGAKMALVASKLPFRELPIDE